MHPSLVSMYILAALRGAWNAPYAVKYLLSRLKLVAEFVKGLDKSLAVETAINPFIASIVADYQRKKQTIIWEPSPCGDYKIEADALRRVLFNLLDNAFRYGGEGEVYLSCHCRKDNLIIRIMDQGVGIPKEQMEAVFQPFFRLRDFIRINLPT